jgi:TolA-binding protein
MDRKKIILIFSSLTIFIIHALSQVPFAAKELGSEFNRGMELFNKEKYPAAIRLLDSYVASEDNPDLLDVSEAQYFSALAALKLFNTDAEFRMTRYIAMHPESPRLNEARLQLGDYFYQIKNYRKAVTYYETVNRQYLQGEQLTEYFFRLGYSLYIKGDYSRALLMFSEIKDIDTDYTPPAIYYFSQIAYEQKMYQTAMEGFMRLKDDETFGSIVPFYIVQMLYLQKDYDGILSMASDLLASAGKERSVELYRFIGDAYYNKGNYKEALPYLEKYSSGAKASGREDKYQLGYCYYKTGDIDKATKLLLEIGSGNDVLSQNIWNVLGDCYLQKNDKKRAQFAFGQASKMNFDRKIREEALFNYAKLTYETAYSPFGEAIAAFQNYIDSYPGSERIQEAYDYLVGTYMQIRNYKAAMASLDKIPEKEPRLQEAYQRVAFYRGLELFKNMEIDASVDMFGKSLKYQKYNMILRARAVYWRAEAYYRLGQYDKARDDYEVFMGLPGSMSLPESGLVRYDLGSAFYNLKDYSNALAQFKSFETGAVRVKPEVLSDARNRIADCYFNATDYQSAINYYDKVIDTGGPDADYAMFQKGFSMGLMNNNRGKVVVLTALIEKYPASTYCPNALFERGRAYVVLEDYRNGEADFKGVIFKYQSSQFAPRAMLQLGLLYYNLGNTEQAIAQFKKVIENFKGTPEARYAMTGLKNAYVDSNDVNSYFAYLKTVEGYDNVNLSEKDSLLYTSGENLYMAAKYDRARTAFEQYLDEFPNGSFKQNAQFYLAECLYSAGEKDEALKFYTEAASNPNSQYLEQALVRAAGILYEKEDYESAMNLYERLENSATDPDNKLIALKGELRSAYQAGDATKTIVAAQKINDVKNVPEELEREAIFMSAKANYSLNNFDEALGEFRKIANEITSEEGAESKYRVAELLYKKGQINESEKIVTEFISQSTPHQYWMARMFLLLSDISARKGDLLQARATLQSLIENYSVEDDGIIDEAKAKLSEINQDNSTK